MTAYATGWIDLVRATRKPRTAASYAFLFDKHIGPALGAVPVERLSRPLLKRFLAERLAAGCSPAYVRVMLAILQSLCAQAVEDGILPGNPAAGLGRQLRIAKKLIEPKALSREQISALLGAAPARFRLLFAFLAGTGARLGEALALRLEDLQLEAGTARIERAFSAGRLETPKAGRSREVDMSRELVAQLRARPLSIGIPWVFHTRRGGPFDPRDVELGFKRALRAAGLPEHFSPHSLRHSYASQLLSAGVSPAYVQRQLGHHSIRLTVDTYGRWLPMERPGAVELLQFGEKTVATRTARVAKLRRS